MTAYQKIRGWQYLTIYQHHHKEVELLKDLQSLGNSAPDVDGWGLAFPLCQSCWLDKCFIHKAQGRKGCQRFKNILRNSEMSGKLSGGAKQGSWATTSTQLDNKPLAKTRSRDHGLRKPLHCLCLVFYIDLCLPSQVREVGVLTVAGEALCLIWDPD